MDKGGKRGRRVYPGPMWQRHRNKVFNATCSYVRIQHTCMREDSKMMNYRRDLPSDSEPYHSPPLSDISCESRWTTPDVVVGLCWVCKPHMTWPQLPRPSSWLCWWRPAAPIYVCRSSPADASSLTVSHTIIITALIFLWLSWDLQNLRIWPITANSWLYHKSDSFLPCDATLARYMLSSCVRLSVCHKLEFYKNG